MTEDRVDFNELAREAAASAYNPRAKRCWGFHRWSMWELAPDHKIQARRCLSCGKLQRNDLEKNHEHRWKTNTQGDVMGDDEKFHIGRYYDQTCRVCGHMRRVTTYT